MKKILYLMHVPWNWIKQRPHFIAENLNQYFKVIIYCEKTYRKNLLVENNVPEDTVCKTMFRLPFDRLEITSKINKIIKIKQLKKVIKGVDIVWLTFPLIFQVVDNILPEKVKLIYDCMDDALEFPLFKRNINLSKKILDCEKKLIQRANIVFLSSEYLRKIIIKRYGNLKHSYVINNAIQLYPNALRTSRSLELNNYDRFFNKSYFNITYLGTISNWLDFDLILKSLDIFQDIRYVLFGISEIRIPKHERIVYGGSVTHDYVYHIMKMSDALVIPFKKCELIHSVNPVKIYEYIYSCTPSIVLEYEETKRFKDFIYLYDNEKAYFQIINKLIKNNIIKQDCDAYIQFAKDNTWENRVQEIVKLIESIS